MMKCNDAIKNYLAIDSYNNLSLKTKFHIRFCPKCKKEIQFLAEKLKSIQTLSPFTMKTSVVNNVMDSIAINHFQEKRQAISNFKWLLVGFLILAGIFLIPFNKQLLFLRLYFGVYFELPLVIVFGLVITIYPAIYIASRLDVIRKIIRFYFDRKDFS